MDSKDEKDKFYYVDQYGFVLIVYADSIEEAYKQILENNENGS